MVWISNLRYSHKCLAKSDMPGQLSNCTWICKSEEISYNNKWCMGRELILRRNVLIGSSVTLKFCAFRTNTSIFVSHLFFRFWDYIADVENKTGVNRTLYECKKHAYTSTKIELSWMWHTPFTWKDHSYAFLASAVARIIHSWDSTHFNESNWINLK